MRTLLTTGLALLLTGLFAQANLYHRATLRFADDAQRHALAAAGVALDHGHGKAGTFTSDFSEEELALIAAAGVDYRVEITDVAAFYRHRNNPAHPLYVAAPAAKNADCNTAAGQAIVTPTNYHGGSMGGYLTYGELLTELDEMYAYDQANNLGIFKPRADNTDPDDPADLRTHEGRYQQWVKISDDPLTEDDGEPGILYTALHHAREPHSMQQLVFFMWYLLENYASDAEVRGIVDNTELYFIPCLNPDGYLYNEAIAPEGGGLWRKNRRPIPTGDVGVDLNRNYNYITPEGNSIFGTSGTSPNPGSDVYPGQAPFSEPETRGNRYFIEQHAVTMALNNHTSGGLLLYPFGYETNTFTEDNSLFEQISAEMVRANGYNNMISAGLYPASGDSDDFMYGYLETREGGTREKIYAMTPEIGPSFWPPVALQERISQDMLVHNLTAAALMTSYASVEETSANAITTTEFTVPYNLTRLGFEDRPLTLRLEAVSDNVTFPTATPPAIVGLQQGERVTGLLEGSVVSGTRTGDELVFDLILDNGRYEQRQRLTKVFGEPTTVLTDAADDLGNYSTSTWGVSTTTFHPGSPSASITDSPVGNYDNNRRNSIRLNETIDLTATELRDATLSFYARWDIEADFDQVQLEVSTDGGQTWTAQCGRHTRPGADNHFTPGEPVYDGQQEDWVLEEISLSDYLGQTVSVRFVLRSDQSVTGDGFYFDDLSVDLLLSDPSAVSQPLTVPLTVQPNPFSGSLTIGTELTDYAYRLTETNGRVVQTAAGLSGRHTLLTGELPAGVYLLTVTANEGQRTVKIVAAKNR